MLVMPQMLFQKPFALQFQIVVSVCCGFTFYGVMPSFNVVTKTINDINEIVLLLLLLLILLLMN